MQRGRRKKIRYIQKMPKVSQFSPRGKPGRPDEIELKVDEYEAIKLADFQGYDQVGGATAMEISRASFGRILRNGRKVVADALVNGKIIRIRIGDVQVGVRQKDLVPGRRATRAREGLAVPVALKDQKLRENILHFQSQKRTQKKTSKRSSR